MSANDSGRPEGSMREKPVFKTKNSPYWYIDISHPVTGQRHRYSTKTTDYDEALRILEDEKVRLSGLSSDAKLKDMLRLYEDPETNPRYRQAKVAYSPKEKVDESMLRQAEKLLMEKTGFQVTLQLDDAPVSGWGVQLSSLDGKVYFNNQLDVRLRRMAKDIKKIIQENTCKAE